MSNNVNQGKGIINLGWKDIDKLLIKLKNEIIRDGMPDLIIGVQRGGLIPSVILSHSLGIRNFCTFDIKVTLNDNHFSDKVSPILGNNDIHNHINGKDIIIIDDIVGSGDTFKTIIETVNKSNPKRVRFATCIVNNDNWVKFNENKVENIIDYIGAQVNGWIVFPWEKCK